MTKTKIEWCDEVWNPVTGCSKVSQGCKNCYAETIAKRFWGERKFTDVQLHMDRLQEPRRWKKPRRVFVNSMSDLFHEDVSESFIAQVFAVMAIAREHSFLILTKRPGNMLRLLDVSITKEIEAWQEQFCYEHGWCPQDFNWPLPNVWLGVSCEDQKAADERIPLLLQTPAAVRFVSCEPLLGAVDLEPWLSGLVDNGNYRVRVRLKNKLDWVICGGESGHGARPMHPDWARGLRDQCVAAGAPFFFKQWGEWLPKDHYLANEKRPVTSWGCLTRSGRYFDKTSTWNGRQGDPEDDYEVSVYRLGKRAAGRELDGRTWDEYPEVER